MDAEMIRLGGGGRTAVYRKGMTVLRPIEAWTPAVHALLRHLEAVGFAGAPRVVGDGTTASGHEVVTFIEGDFVHPHAWTDEGAAATGSLLRSLHDASASFVPPPDAQWRHWFGRPAPGTRQLVGHCDTGPWNIVARDGLPVAFIDWETAGPVDPLVELAHTAWLNAQLHGDDVAERVGLPPAEARAGQLRLLVDGYRLAPELRAGFVSTMIEFAIRDCANEADEARVGPDSTDPTPLWALAWRARAAAWMISHRRLLEAALA